MKALILEEKIHIILNRSQTDLEKKSILKRNPSNLLQKSTLHLIFERNPPAYFSRLTFSFSVSCSSLSSHQFARLLVEKFKCIHPALARSGHAADMCATIQKSFFATKLQFATILTVFLVQKSFNLLLMARSFLGKKILWKSLDAKHHQCLKCEILFVNMIFF